MKHIIEIIRKDNETSTSAIRRFTRKFKQSGILRRVRSLRYQTQPDSKLIKKRRALRRIEKVIEITRLKKLGKMK